MFHIVGSFKPCGALILLLAGPDIPRGLWESSSLGSAKQEQRTDGVVMTIYTVIHILFVLRVM